ncbi:unnamed protein product [Polarella glacialis]|uniref:Uncharacterized protein n=1 Tax=Polarella glacialis TaxID=89957 RepID=A0A813GTP3_POLGL|nr:unnamed protein product [Polarella glacialis]
MGDLAKLQARLTQCQVELAKLSKTCTEREQRFVAQRLVQDAGESLKRLQEEAASAIKATELLLGGGADNDGGIGGHRAELLSLWRLQAAVAALQAHQQKTGSSVDVLFAEVAGGKPASKAAFVEWATRLSELTGNDEALLTQEQAAEAWPIVAKGASSLFLDHFKAWLRERWVCTVGVPAWDAATGGKQVGNVEVGEGLEVLETGSGEPGERARCLLARDGAEVWVAVTVDSKPSFKPSPPIAGRLESIAAAISAVHKRCAAGAEAADRKATEVASVKQGPLMEVKTKLLEVKGLLGQEQSKLDVLKKRLAITKAGIEQERKEELVTLREEKCKVFAAESVREATASVEAAEGKAAKVMDNAKPGEAERLAKELGVFELEALKKAADEALESLSDAKAVVARLLASHEAHKGPSRNLLLEARVELTKLGSRANTAERKCRTATEALRTAHLQVVKTALMRAKNSLRIAFRKLGKGADEVYDQVAGKSSEISSEQFQKFVTSLPSHDLSPEQVTLLYNEFGKYGLRKPAFCKAVQEYCTCLREIAITDGFDISSSSTVRKLDKGEFFEVLEGPVEDAAAEVRRVRGRALRDSSMGWVTIKGNQGTAFLKPREKPLLWASGDAEMRMTCQSSSSTVRRMKKDEVLELLEGPREEVFEAELYLKGTASKDGAKGWILLREPAGSNSALQSTKFYKCRSTIAMTDSFDITSCKVVRKVAIGEALEVIGGQEERADAEISITRLRFRALKDGKEGWVTLKGNQGTVFVEASTSHYVLEKATALRAAASADAAEIRSLEPGEALEAEGPPQEVTPDTKLVMKARSLEDWQAGWVSFVAGPGAPLKPWMPKYVCRAPVDITWVLSLAGGAVMRQAAPEEVFEAVEGPIVESSSGLRRIRVATAADGVIGWATLRASDDKVYLEVA